MSTLGRRFQNERERLGLSRTKLAALCDYSYVQVCRVEQGKQAPGAPLLAGLARAGGDIHFVLLGEPHARPSAAAATATATAHPGELSLTPAAKAAVQQQGLPQAIDPLDTIDEAFRCRMLLGELLTPEQFELVRQGRTLGCTDVGQLRAVMARAGARRGPAADSRTRHTGERP